MRALEPGAGAFGGGQVCAVSPETAPWADTAPGPTESAAPQECFSGWGQGHAGGPPDRLWVPGDLVRCL